MEDYVIDDYIKLLANGERAKEDLGKFLIVPSEFYGLLRLSYEIYKNNTKKQDEYLKLAKDKYASKIKNLMDYNTVIIPAEVGEHWALFVVKPKKGDIWAYDSGNVKLSGKANYLKNFMKLMGIKKSFHLDYYFGPKQENDTDCGVFMLEFLRWIMFEGDGEFKQKDMPRIRERIKQELNAKRLQPKFKYEDTFNY